MATDPDTLAYPPRGLSRDEAARYIGVGTTKFDQMVADRRMPRPKRIDGRLVWDRLQIDAAFSDLPEDVRANPLDRMFEKRTEMEDPSVVQARVLAKLDALRKQPSKKPRDR